MMPLPDASMGTSACIALPNKRSRAASPSNNCSAMTPAGSNIRCASLMASAVPRARNSCNGPRTGGNGENSVDNTASLIRSH